MPTSAHPPLALVFDVFGTLVDWRTAIAREAGALPGIADGEAFADAWRALYQPTMEEVRAGREPFARLDVLHRRSLDRLLRERGLDPIDEATRAHLNLAWHRLDAWAEVGAALVRLRRHFVLAPCSNGNVSLMVDLARRNGWHWDAVLGAEFARAYKPQPAVYLDAASALGCEPGQVMMVAAHSSDLAAAAAVGLRTAFIARLDEHGPGRGERVAMVPVDHSATDLSDLADQLNAN